MYKFKSLPSSLVGKIIVAFILVILPPVVFEKYTYFLYLTSPITFFAFSVRRLWFDILWFVASGALCALIIGKKKWFSLIMPAIACASFILIVYVEPLCTPRECYVSSTDGLGFLRDFLLFTSLGMLACNSVISGDLSFGSSRRSKAVQTIYSFVFGALFGYALSFFPLIHIFAGVSLPYPLNYVQWFFACAIPGFAGAFMMSEQAKSMNLSTRWLGILAGLSGVILGIALDFPLPCEACSGYSFSIGSMLLACAFFSFLGLIVQKKIATIQITRKRLYVSLVTGIIIPLLVLTLFLSLFSPSYQMSVVNSVEPGISNTSLSPLEVGSTFVYSGGYLDSNQVRVTAVGVSVNFGNSSISTSTSNFLAAGVGDQSPNCCKDGLDLAYRADAVLFSNGTEALLARAWWACGGDMACAGYYWQDLLHFGVFDLRRGTLSNWVDLQMNWTSPTVIGWFYRVHYSTNGSVSPWILYSSFTPPKIQNHYFDAGLSSVGSGNPNGYAFFYQFGVSSARLIKSDSWNVMMRCPNLVENGTWTCLPHAGFISGQLGYWKILYSFGKSYTGLGFNYSGNYTVEFYFVGTSPRDETMIW